MNDKIKWACIQPLTGGMYLGAEEAIGHPAEWILTYKGLNDVKYDKDGNIISAANEYNLIKYLEKHNRMPKYYQIHNHDMFSGDIMKTDPEIYLNDNLETPDYTDLDLVVAVPVCSGLSMATSGSDETKIARNNNMLWIANYTLGVIKPKCYIFENAPTLMGSRGVDVRKELENIAIKYGYSLLYYKTDTKLHYNCQRRPRTFIIFEKHSSENANEKPQLFDYEDNHINVVDFFNNIPTGLTQTEPVKSQYHNYMLIDFMKYKFGNQYKEHVIDMSLMKYIEVNNLFDEFINFVKNNNYIDEQKTKVENYINHIKYKRSIGKNYFANDVCLFRNETFPAVMFRTIPNMIHPFKDEICSVRDYLTLMGHPYDFELYGGECDLPKIGQNVPVKTAKFIVEQAIINLRIAKRLDTSCNCVYQDNIKKTIEIIY